MSGMLRDTMAEIFREGESLVDFLPYAGEQDGVFVLVDGSAGLMWECRPVEGDVIEEAALETLAGHMGSVISKLSVRAAAQVLCQGGHDIAPVTAAYRSLTATETPGAALAAMDMKTAFYEGRPKSRWDETRGLMRPRRLRYFVALRYFPRWEAPLFPGRARAYRGGGGAAREEWEQLRAELLRLGRPLAQGLATLGLDLVPCGRAALTELVYQLLNPLRARSLPSRVFQDGFLRDQVLYHAPVASGRGFMLDGMHTRVITLKDLPAATRPGLMTLGRYGAPLSGVCREFLLVMNLVVPNQQDALQRLKWQKSFAFLQRGPASGNISEEAVQQQEELSGIIADTFRGGQPLVHARVHFIPYAASAEEADRHADAALQAMARSGGEGLVEEIIAPSLFLSCLPLNFDHHFEPFVRRQRRLPADNAADLLPLYGTLRGTPTPALLYLDRNMAPVTLDLFDSSTNPHTVVIGASGAGKSFFINDLIYQYARTGAWFFVLDKGHSYQKTCAVLDGEYLSFDLERPVRLNPFVRQPDTGMRAFLADMLAVMASGGDERDRLSREERGLLQGAISEAYGRSSGRETVLGDVVEVLRDEHACRGLGAPAAMGVRLALRLSPFTSAGPYGKFFDGPDERGHQKRFTVFELGALSAHPDLQLVVLLNVMFLIGQVIHDPALAGVRKLFVIDEAWQLLRTSNTAEFIGNAFKTFRKYRCAAVAVTQEANDLLRHPAGQAIVANTANKVFLRQDPGVIDALCRDLSLGPASGEVLRSLKTVKGAYAEALFCGDGTAGVLRLVPDPFLYWAATSDPKDNRHLWDRKDQCGSLVTALQHCAGEHPYGIR